MLNMKRAGRGRKALIVLVIVIFGVIFFGWAVTKLFFRVKPPERLDLMATVRTDDEFWLYYKGEKNLLPREQGVALLRAMERAQPWESDFGYFNMGRYPPNFRPIKASLTWCKDGGNKRELEENVLWIHKGNETISYKGTVYIVPEEERGILDRMFPLEEEKVTATKSRKEKASGTNDRASGPETLPDGK
jgi:hypothetical protein